MLTISPRISWGDILRVSKIAVASTIVKISGLL